MWHGNAELIADPNAVDPETAVVKADTRSQFSKKVQEAIRRLPPKQEMAVTLTYFNGLTYSEAADQMGLTVNTVKTHIRQAKARLLVLLSADAIKRLPSEQARALRLQIDGLTYKKIAKKMGNVDTDAVKTQIRQAKKCLFKFLTAEGFHELIEKQ